MNLNNQAFESILDNLHDGLYLTDNDRRIIYWNKAAERITGFSAEEVVGRSCADNILCHVDADGTQLCEDLCPLAKTIQDANQREDEIFLHHKNGHRVPVSVRVSTAFDLEGRVSGGIELFTDLSNRKATELRVKELEELTLIDHLTRMANRAYLEKELNVHIEEMHRLGSSFGVLFIDIDHFKRINDTYGHAVGDEVIKLVGNTLTVNARPFDLFGRWGGEEFIGLIRNISMKNLEILAERMRILIGTAFIMQDARPLSVTVSIGAALANSNDNYESLLERADNLLYQSKNSGRNQVSLDQPFPEAEG